MNKVEVELVDYIDFHQHYIEVNGKQYSKSSICYVSEEPQLETIQNHGSAWRIICYFDFTVAGKRFRDYEEIAVPFRVMRVPFPKWWELWKSSVVKNTEFAEQLESSKTHVMNVMKGRLISFKEQLRGV